ncbi:transcriptional regulator, ArsR family [Cellulomonas flavigena DSM 20109]|uniref:Transcriptional regulator, ArsR family n=1 Tax=Cellulomonas flavigena (strain ATCC 482 / DSM 20109 / BCRC 11376 / JCM 18109 / NBRC 3775 / NCIMB 8073 / NRS 134) TaxID=446466 RepID=D5UDU8_CELFN|nr:metalloregulator ArsR/SmtB family transcription factor [Cellulomonas flavigena]ADG74506.1 transcriptional regulator, ArsR family [Cellulomonas flavigena DSM 20109]
MHPLDALGDPVRRRLVELVGAGERPAGELAAAVGAEFGISQPAVSRHLRVLREVGLVVARPQGTVRLYALRPQAVDEVEQWAASVVRAWRPRLDALATEVARGHRERAAAGTGNGTTEPGTGSDRRHEEDT